MDALEAPNERTDELRREHDLLKGTVDKQDRRIRALDERVIEIREELGTQDERIAVGGIPTAAAGLVVAGLGLIAQLAGVILTPAP